MSWRGQGGKRAKGRRGDQDPELDNTAWLAELEREAAAQTDDEEEDWASTLRGRRPPAPPPQPPPDPGWAPAHDQGAEPGGGGPGYGTDPGLGEAPPAPDPDWSWRSPDVDAFGEPAASTQADPGPGWERYEGVPRSHPAPEAFGGAPQDAGTAADWEGSQTANGGWADPGDQSVNASGTDLGDRGDHGPWAGPGDQDDHGTWAVPGERAEPGSWVGAGDGIDGGAGAGGGADLYGLGESPAGDGSAGDEDRGGWRSAGVDTPTGAWDSAEPVGREPDYPALFGELYRRSAAQQDPIWEAPPAVEPMPEQGQPDPPAATWPFEETTQSWEPSDRSFIWPADELPSTPAEWDQPGSTDWLDDPAPRAVPPEPDQTAAWPVTEPGARAWEEPAPAPESRDSPWAGQPGAGNGVAPPPAGLTTPAPPPPPAGSVGPPPDDWAAAISTDVPAARRAADPSATGVWPPDEAADAEPGVPLGPGSRPPHAAGPQAPPGERPGGRATRSRGPGSGAPPATELPGPAGSGLAGPPGAAGAGAGVAGPGTGAGRAGPAGGAPGAPGARSGRPAAGTGPRAGAGTAGGAAGRERRPPRDPRGGATELAGGPAARTSPRLARAPADAAGDGGADRGALPVDTGKGRRNRPGGERQARSWPRVVAVISWIVLVMVLCWYYVFPWLERVLPENF